MINKDICPSCSFAFMILFISISTGSNGCKAEEVYMYSCKEGIAGYEEIKTTRYFKNINKKDNVISLRIQSQSHFLYFRKVPQISWHMIFSSPMAAKLPVQQSPS